MHLSFANVHTHICQLIVVVSTIGSKSKKGKKHSSPLSTKNGDVPP